MKIMNAGEPDPKKSKKVAAEMKEALAPEPEEEETDFPQSEAEIEPEPEPTPNPEPEAKEEVSQAPYILGPRPATTEEYFQTPQGKKALADYELTKKKSETRTAPTEPQSQEGTGSSAPDTQPPSA